MSIFIIPIVGAALIALGAAVWVALWPPKAAWISQAPLPRGVITPSALIAATFGSDTV